jgi:hypothetical protein
MATQPLGTNEALCRAAIMTFDAIKIARVRFSLLCVVNPALYSAASR